MRRAASLTAGWGARQCASRDGCGSGQWAGWVGCVAGGEQVLGACLPDGLCHAASWASKGVFRTCCPYLNLSQDECMSNMLFLSCLCGAFLLLCTGRAVWAAGALLLVTVTRIHLSTVVGNCCCLVRAGKLSWQSRPKSTLWPRQHLRLRGRRSEQHCKSRSGAWAKARGVAGCLCSKREGEALLFWRRRKID